MENYYKLPYVSNSDLGALKMLLTGKIMPANIQETFDFGNLIDAMLTEPDKVAEDGMKLMSEDRVIEFSEETFRKALGMKESGIKHDLLNVLMTNMRFQHIVLRNQFTFECDGEEFILPARCKFDGLNTNFSTGMDLKSTACKDKKSFQKAIFHFDYDRQAAWYMDLAGINRQWIIGISKHRNKKDEHDIFPFAIQRGDETYNSGLAKYRFWARKWAILIQNLNIDHLSI